jgi:tripartite-type tricarboxylate transporter receptor subunit TctC
MKTIVALVLAAGALAAQAQSFPSRPVRIVVPFPPGGSGDTSTRLLAEHMAKHLGQSIVVENRPGGGTVIGTQNVKSAPADGHSLLVVYPSFIINPSIRPGVGYELKDFRAVGQTIALPMVIAAHPSLPARTLKELIELARSKPAALGYGTPGPASTHHIAAEMFRLAAGVELLHVPYQGGGPALTATLGGHTPLVYGNVSEIAAHARSGKIRALVVSSRERAASLPDIPTYGESGFPQLEASNWSGMVVPAATPTPVVAQLNVALVRALAQPDVLEKFRSYDFSAMAGTPEQFEAHLRSEAARYAKVIKEARIKAE